MLNPEEFELKMGKRQNRKSRETRESKKVYYFIVEGCTEEKYIKLLKILYKKDATIKNCNGGSARNVLNEAKKIITKNKDEYLGYIVLV